MAAAIKSSLPEAGGFLQQFLQVYEIEPNTPRDVDATMDGPIYMRLMCTAPCNMLQKARAYMMAGDLAGSGFVEATKTTEYPNGLSAQQEDGAPGHGYNNKRANPVDGRPGAPTASHEQYVLAAIRNCFAVYKQSAKTPELNMLDLGVWYHLHHRVLARYKEFLEYRKRKELLDHLWAVIEEEFYLIDPEVLYVIAEHKLDIAKQIKACGGARLLKEVHGGARKRTKDDIAAAKAVA